MKRSVILLLILGLLVFALPLCALMEGDPANVLAVGETRELTGVSKPYYDLSTKNLTPGILTLNYRTVTGTSPGMGSVRCTWTRKDHPTITEDIQVKVYAAPASVALSESSLKLGVEDVHTLTAILPAGSGGAVTFSSDHPSLRFRQDERTAQVYADEPCVGKITVTTYNGRSASCRVEVVPGPTGMTLSPQTMKLFVGQTHALSATAVGGYTSNGVRFQSHQPGICTVSQAGVVTAVAAGYTHIQASLSNGHTELCAVTVYDEPDSIHFSGIPTRMGVGESIEFTIKDSGGRLLSLDISVSNPSVLGCINGNILAAVKEGTCKVTASSALKSASFDVTVLSAPTGIALSPAGVTLKELETAALTPTLPEGSASRILYDSDNQEVASVSGSGVIKALTPGSAVITARTFNSKSASCQVTVVPSDITYTLSPKSAQLGIGKTLQLRLTDPNGKAVSATYKSSRSEHASVDQNGLVTGKTLGQTSITATVADGRKYTAAIEVLAIPDYITVSPTEMYLLVGQGDYFTVDSDVGIYFNSTYKSSNTKVARVGTNRYVEAVGEGMAIVTVTSFNGKTAEMLVTVFPKEGPLIPGAGFIALLGVGQTVNMDVRDMYGNAVACTYVSSDPKSCSVSSKGVLTGLKANTVTLITATAKDGRICETAVGVYPAPTYLRLNKDAVNLPVKGTYQLIPEVQPDSLPLDIAFTTSNGKVATVSADGKITAKGAGTCTITAKTYNGKTDTVKVTVGSAPTSVSLSPAKLTLGLNETRKLKVTLSTGAVSDYSFQCDDPSILSVSENGTVKGIKTGSATLTVKTYNGKTADCLVTVVNAPGSITLTSPAKSIGVKQTVQLKASLPDGTAGTIKYSSGNTKVATVDSSGKVTGIKTGSVTITATTYNGKKATVTLQVKKAPSSIKLNTKSAKLGVGDTVKLSATLKSGSAGTYTYKSSNAKVATVDKTGLVTATGTGKATITATTYNGKKATCTVTVYKQPGSVSVKSAYTLKKGRTYTLKVAFPKNTYSRVTFSSSNEKVAAVDSAGKIRGVGRGTATITVTCANGKTAKCVVTVK